MPPTIVVVSRTGLVWAKVAPSEGAVSVNVMGSATENVFVMELVLNGVPALSVDTA